MLEKLKEKVFKANLELVKKGLVIHTWGNASGRDPSTGMIVIKPSGVGYEYMKPGDMVVLYPDGRVAEGNYKPSTDAPTHLFLYNEWGDIGGVVHTHSSYATSWAQAVRAIPPYGTTHADHFNGYVPCTRELKPNEIKNDYELNTGKVITQTMKKLDHQAIPSVLVANHGPFSWGKDVAEAVYNAIALEEIAMMAFNTVLLGRSEAVSKALLDKHFTRKHGKEAYYGQTIK